METNGSYGPRAVKFLQHLAYQAESRGLCDRSDFLEKAFRTLSVTLQRGNTMILTYQLTDAMTRQAQERDALSVSTQARDRGSQANRRARGGGVAQRSA